MNLGKLPVGAKLLDASGGLSFLVAAQNHPGYGGTTLISEQVVRIAPFDAGEPENPKQRGFDNVGEYGSNDFSQSNLCQWLNSRGNNWYKPTHLYDAPPIPEYIRHGANAYVDASGFLSRLSKPLADELLNTSIPLIRKTEDGGFQVQTFQAKVFLPSRAEIGFGPENGLSEGTFLPLFRDFRIKGATLCQEAYEVYNSPWHSTSFKPDSRWRWWLRTPNTKYAYLVRYVGEMGGLSYAPAFSDIVGVRPMMNVSPGLAVSDVGEDGNIYRLLERG